MAIRKGTIGNDTLEGTAGDDFIYGYDPNNRAATDGGDDKLYGLGGDDRLFGGIGKDILDGGAGRDLMSGGVGDDIYYVDHASDIASELAGEGTDLVFSSVDYTLSDNIENLTLTGSARIGRGNALSNVITGNALDNTLRGGGAVGIGAFDTLIGGAGNDTYEVSSLADKVVEQALGGNDTIILSTSSNAYISEYTLSTFIENLTLGKFVNIETIHGNRLNNVIVASNGGTIFGADGNDHLSGGLGTNILDGGSGDDRLFGNAHIDFLDGGSGNDEIHGGGEYDHLSGGTGDDLLYGGADADLIEGGDGNDRLFGEDGDDYIVAGAGDNYIDGGAGRDHVSFSTVSDAITVDLRRAGVQHIATSLGANTFVSIESFTGGSGADRIIGNEFGNTLYGLAGNDKLYGFEGADELAGDDGNDRLDGGSGNDTIYLDSGNDILIGGDGIDTVSLFMATSLNLSIQVAQNTGQGMDIVRGFENATGSSGDDRITGTTADNVLRGGLGNDILVALGGNDKIFGDRGNDQLVGGAGEDQLFGGKDNDELNGGDGADILSGDEGDDILEGGNGDDVLDGGGGNDVMTGGAGHDRFVATSGTIADFEQGADTIDFSMIDARPGGWDDAFWFIGTDAFPQDGSGYLRYYIQDGVTYIEAIWREYPAAEPSEKIYRLKLDGAHALQASDFLL